MNTIEFDREEDGRWIAEVTSLPGVMAYGVTQAEVQRNVEALAVRVLASAPATKYICHRCGRTVTAPHVCDGGDELEIARPS